MVQCLQSLNLSSETFLSIFIGKFGIGYNFFDSRKDP